MAGVFQVMSYAVGALDKKDVDPPFMTKLAKIATAEIISSKELNTDWQRAASGLLVSIGLHLPDIGTNMLSWLLHVSHPTAKQAVITAIDLLVADTIYSNASVYKSSAGRNISFTR